MTKTINPHDAPAVFPLLLRQAAAFATHGDHTYATDWLRNAAFRCHRSGHAPDTIDWDECFATCDPTLVAIVKTELADFQTLIPTPGPPDPSGIVERAKPNSHVAAKTAHEAAVTRHSASLMRFTLSR